MITSPVSRGFLMVVVASLAMSACSKKTAPPPVTVATTTTTPTPAPPPPPEPSETIPQAQVEDIFFDYDQFTLRGDSRRILDSNGAVLKSGGASMTLEGHCDERGTVEYNLALGEKRARSTKQYLVSLGVPDSQLKTISYGEERPFNPGHDEHAWSQNRRVHFKK